MLQQALDEFKSAFNKLSEAVENYNKNLRDTKNKNWAKNVESCRVKVKAALEVAVAKLAKLTSALDQFKIDAVKNAKMSKDGVFTLDDDAKRKVQQVEFWMNFAETTLETAETITRVF